MFDNDDRLDGFPDLDEDFDLIEGEGAVRQVATDTPTDAADTGSADEAATDGGSSDDAEAAAEPTAPATPVVPDERLIAAHDLALSALREITPASSIGAPAGHRVEADGVVSLLFETKLLGYPGWFWTVSLARVEGEEPTVLEAELLPGEVALIAPDWVPWAVRLAEYQAAQAVAAAAAAEAGIDLSDASAEDMDSDDDDDDDDDSDDDDDMDESEFETDGSPMLHSGDLDGVDIDELDGVDLTRDDDDESDDDDSDDDDDDDSDDDDDDEDDSDDDDDNDDDIDDEDDNDDDDDEDDDDFEDTLPRQRRRR